MPLGQPAQEKGEQGGNEQRHDAVLEPGGPVRTQPCQNKEQSDGCDGNDARGQKRHRGNDSGQGFSETDAVKRH